MSGVPAAQLTKKRTGPYLILEVNVTEAEIQKPVSRLLAVYPDWDGTCMLISALDTKPQYRSRGYASSLLSRAIWEARRNGCKFIKLDDCSDAFNDDEHNIYVKHGFTYDQAGLPDMRLKL